MLASALWSVAQKTQEVVRTVAEDGLKQLGVCKSTRDYHVSDKHFATCGPAALWKLHAAVARSATAIHKEVCVWVLDKRALQG